MNIQPEIIVVGGGPIGAAATRHLAESGRSCAVVAAPEPTDWATSPGPFASHHDAGRITRVNDRDPVWAEMAARSIVRYAEIETRAGIRLHDPRGVVRLGPDLTPIVDDAVARGADARLVDPDWLFETTGIRTPSLPGLEAAYEAAPAGVVNPRAMVAAQLALAERAGARVIRGAAEQMSTAGDRVIVSGPFGEIGADRVLLATGAYGGSLAGVDLKLKRRLRTILRAELGPAPEMPSLILGPAPHPDVADLYWTPPVVYPDGRIMFKIGCEMIGAPQAASVDDLTDWFNAGGDPHEVAALLASAQELLPTRRFDSWDSAPCVVTRTASGYPHLGFIDERVAVAVGGNGAAAKSSDEIGRLAALIVAGDDWDSPHDPALFTPN